MIKSNQMPISNFTNYKNFNKIADTLLNDTLLIVKNNRFRICEIEFYYKGEEHEDKYTHCTDDQLSFLSFYFHKYKNGTYKAGTYKGMDLTFGNEKDIYYGVLVRSMLDLDSNEFIEGPCRCVNKILELNECKTVKDFLDNKKLPLKLYSTNQNIYIRDYNTQEKKEIKKEQIYIGPRVGLSDKYPKFVNLNYRYAIMIKKIKKQKKFNELLHY